MKYIIDIEDEPFWRQSALHGEDAVFKANGFNALVFDKHGLDKLTPLDKELDEAYQRGYEVGAHEATTLEYQQGLDDAWECARRLVWETSLNEAEHMGFIVTEDSAEILNDYTVTAAMKAVELYDKKPKDEIKVGDIITDGKINYLVTDITDKSYVALQGTDFEPAYIGKDYIGLYHNLHDSKDMQKIAEEINKAIKVKQRDCHTCKHPNSIECVDCRSFGRWQPKEGVE